jgi:FtsP/CotA-like multicopper oxidase with cupredoxin domain
MTRPLYFTLATAVASLTGACSGMDMSNMDGMGGMDGGMMIPEVIEVDASEGPFEPSAAPDLDPAPNVVEVALEAKASDVEIAPGRTISMWTYNGQLPGPRIEARAGDTVRIRFKNSLPEATTIHWHGVRVPAAMDGVPAVQSPIAAGAEFTYEFVVPDAGTFWYHPHVRSDEQVERGLYGAFVVRDAVEPTTTTDRTVVLDDLLVDSNWQLSDFDPMMQAMVGRQGNVILANGWAHPIAGVARGGLHRFRFINAANARYFRLALPGHRLIQIGTDGGLLPASREVDELLLVPGERADVLVVASGEANETMEWTSLRYDRGHGTGDLPDAVVFQMKHGSDAPIVTPATPSAFAPIAELPAATVQRELKLEESMAMGGGDHGAGHGSSTTDMAPVFSINGEVFPDVTPLTATLETVEEWSIVNTTEMDHPFHLHGFRFQVVSVDGAAPGVVAWRDSINIPAEKTVKFRVRLEDNPGTWMFHCHILEHAERGMMGELEVAAP